jgi:hypothetical protein
VLLGDPPIDWDTVRTKADYERFADRDLSLAETVQREVVARHHKGLLIAGGVHVAYDRDSARELPDRRRGAGELLRRRGVRYFAFWRADRDPGRAPCANAASSPCVVLVKGSPYERSSFLPFAPKGISVLKIINGEKKWVPLDESDWPPARDLADGLMFYPAQTMVLPSLTLYDDGYRAELRRRAAILSEVYGMDFNKEMESMLAETTP